MYPTQTETQIQTPAEAPATVTPQLTRREHDLVRALTRGLSNRQIAGEFSLSEQTVKNQLTTIYQKAAHPEPPAAGGVRAQERPGLGC